MEFGFSNSKLVLRHSQNSEWKYAQGFFQSSALCLRGTWFWSHEVMSAWLYPFMSVRIVQTQQLLMLCVLTKSALSSCLCDSLTCAFKNRLKMEWTNILSWLPLGSLTGSSPPLWCPFTFTCYKHELIFQYPSAIFIQTLSFYFHFYSLSVPSLFSFYLHVSLFVSLSQSCFFDRISLLLFSIHVFGQGQKPAALECMSCRSAVNCAAGAMSF